MSNKIKLDKFMSGPNYNILQINSFYYTKLENGIKLLTAYNDSMVLCKEYFDRIPPNEFWRYKEILFYPIHNSSAYYIITQNPQKYNPTLIKSQDKTLTYFQPEPIPFFVYPSPCPITKGRKDIVINSKNLYRITKPMKKNYGYNVFDYNVFDSDWDSDENHWAANPW